MFQLGTAGQTVIKSGPDIMSLEAIPKPYFISYSNTNMTDARTCVVGTSPGHLIQDPEITHGKTFEKSATFVQVFFNVRRQNTAP
jgi:hypothetical protein